MHKFTNTLITVLTEIYEAKGLDPAYDEALMSLSDKFSVDKAIRCIKLLKLRADIRGDRITLRAKGYYCPKQIFEYARDEADSLADGLTMQEIQAKFGCKRTTAYHISKGTISMPWWDIPMHFENGVN